MRFLRHLLLDTGDDDMQRCDDIELGAMWQSWIAHKVASGFSFVKHGLGKNKGSDVELIRDYVAWCRLHRAIVIQLAQTRDNNAPYRPAVAR